MSTPAAPATRPEIARRALLDQRRALAVWSVSLVALVALYAVIWPSVRGNTQWRDLFDTLPSTYRALFTAGGTVDLSTPAGYLGVELLGFLGPALVAVYGVVTGANAVAGDEDRGTLELTLSAPVSRARVLVERAAALTAGVAVLMVALGMALAVFSALFDMRLGVDRIAAAAVALGAFGWFAGVVALAVGAATGSPGVARGVGALAAVAAYLVNALAQITDVVDGLRPLSPFYLLLGNDPLTNGLAWGRSLAVVGAGIAILVLGGAALRRRDLR